MTVAIKKDIEARVLETAKEAALQAGELLASGYNRPKTVRHKGDIDLVTEFDLAAEKIIVDKIRKTFPDHAILAEEGGKQGSLSDDLWYIDPLDGTTNFAHGFPVFCVSIAYEKTTPDGPEPRVGVVYDPLRREMFTAMNGQGAFLNGTPISASSQDDLSQSLVATGLPYNIKERPPHLLERLQAILEASQGVRRAGSAALDLCYVASGRLDGYWESNLSPWDTAAGYLIVMEAGGMVSNFAGEPFHPRKKEVLATNGLIHYNMRQILNGQAVESETTTGRVG